MTDSCCAALTGAQRGTLHVILTTGNNNALRVTSEAEQFLRADHPHLARFISKLEQGSLGQEAAKFSDTREVATAVNAQILSLTPALTTLGEFL